MRNFSLSCAILLIFNVTKTQNSSYFKISISKHLLYASRNVWCFSKAASHTFNSLTDLSFIRDCENTSVGWAAFLFLLVTPCMIKQEQCLALLEVHLKFPALEEGSHTLIFNRKKQTYQLSRTEEPAIKSQKYQRLILFLTVLLFSLVSM